MSRALPNTEVIIAVDTVVIAITKNKPQVLLAQRADTKKESRVLPGWFLQKKETLLAAARRKVEEETGYKTFSIHQIGIFDDIKRDPRWRVVSIAFLAITNSTSFIKKISKHTKNAQFFSIKKLPPLLYDHKKIIQSAWKKLQKLVMYTSIAKDLLPKEFTLTALQKVYENILGTKLNVRNFRTKLLHGGIVIPTGNTEIGVWHRPAQYYIFDEENR